MGGGFVLDIGRRERDRLGALPVPVSIRQAAKRLIAVAAQYNFLVRTKSFQENTCSARRALHPLTQIGASPLPKRAWTRSVPSSASFATE